ncbi:MAG: hypothetical protein JWM95_4449, partial [Gemmatimonadetes bacterium]|nr:hypothetical protein [Gemmatimonadota bacterium]
DNVRRIDAITGIEGEAVGAGAKPPPDGCLRLFAAEKHARLVLVQVVEPVSMVARIRDTSLSNCAGVFLSGSSITHSSKALRILA